MESEGWIVDEYAWSRADYIIKSSNRIPPGRDGNTLDAFPGFIYSPSFLEFAEKYYTSNS